MSEEKVTRRNYLKYTGAAIGGLIVGGALGYLAKPTEVIKETVTAPAVEKTITVTAPAVEKTVEVPALPLGKGLKFSYIIHGGEENVFWNTVHLGMIEAAKLTGCDAVMVRPKVEGDLAMEIANFEAAIAAKPDGIIVPICYTELLPLVKKATDAGIPVLVSNIDAPNPEDRIKAGGLCYIGQNLRQAGYFMAKTLSKYFPSGTHAMIIIEGPGMVWAEERCAGIVEFLKEYGCTYERLNASTDYAVVESLSSAYLHAHPETGAIFSVGYFGYIAGKVLKDMGVPPGKIPIAVFDLVPPVIDGIKEGYVTIAIDQQPYLQGFLPIIQLVLMKKYALSAWDVNTGNAVVDKTNVAVVEELSKKGYR